MSSATSNRRHDTTISLVLALSVLAGIPLAAGAQSFDSGSTGADGALDLTEPGTVVFDPRAFDPALDPEGDNIYHFNTITIGPGVTVQLSGQILNGPVVWLAAGAVVIDGVIDLDGEDGQNGATILNDGSRFPAVPGAGGFPGGVGGTSTSPPQAGSGPGGGGIGKVTGANNNQIGGGGGHVAAGQSSFAVGNGGAPYGNDFVVPLVGGSGGGGGIGGTSGGGGAGGGALLVASSASITVDGTITADGGIGGLSSFHGFFGRGGSGSGGAIRLVAPLVGGTGTLTAQGGSQQNSGSAGRIRLEAFQHAFTGGTDPAPRRATPFRLFLPEGQPELRVVSVAGQPVASSPTGSFTVPDVTIDAGSPATVVIAARHVPLGTVVRLHLFSENAPDQTVDSGPLTGTLEDSTATATITIPSGFSRGFVRATWTDGP